MDSATTLFQSKLDARYPDKYQVLTPYSHRKTSLQVRCLLHEHEFEAVPQRLLAGTKNCPLCYKEKLTASNQRVGAERRASVESVQAELTQRGCTAALGDIVCYDVATWHVTRVCPTHGHYAQDISNTYKGHGCPKCAQATNSKQYGDKYREINLQKYLERCLTTHEGFYSYPHFGEEYHTSRSKVTILCPEHGEFQQRVEAHAGGARCPKCAITWSKGERQIFDWLHGLGYDVEHHVRDVIAPSELDLYIPSRRLAIEYNGLRYHSTAFMQDRNYHLNKLRACTAADVKLIQVWEDEWRDRQGQIKSLIWRALGGDYQSRVFARQCQLVQIEDYSTVKRFLDQHHVQGANSASVYYGLLYGAELIAVMTFGKGRSLRGDSTTWELTRYATSRPIVAGASRLLQRFVRDHTPRSIVSYSDQEKFSGEMYEKLGFRRSSELAPDYKTTRDFKTRQAKQATKRQRLARDLGPNFDPEMTERENCEQNGIYRLYDSGKVKWIWTAV